MDQNQIDEAQRYIKQNVSGVLEKLTLDLLEDKPSKLVDYMVNWLDEKGE